MMMMMKKEKMEEEPCRLSYREGRWALIIAEEAAMRRFEAADWLNSMVGPLALPQEPTEQELIACLRSGIVLCNIINKVQPGAIPKVVANQSFGFPSPAYQYFENIRNFLVAVKELQLPSFEAFVLERDPIDAASVAKVVDCILALKCFHESRGHDGGKGTGKHLKSPLVQQSVVQIPLQVISSDSLTCARRLDMPNAAGKEKTTIEYDQEVRDAMDSFAKIFSDLIFSSKENVDESLLDLWAEGKADPIKLFRRIMSNYLGEKQLESILEGFSMQGNVTDNDSAIDSPKCHDLCLRKGTCSKWCLLEAKEREIKAIRVVANGVFTGFGHYKEAVKGLRALLSRTRADFGSLQGQLQNDFAQLGNLIESLSGAASRYQQVIKENRHLDKMIQDIKGNLRVFCRIRPMIEPQSKSSVHHIGKDGSLVVYDPSDPQSSRKLFQLNKVFGPAATQDEVYKEIQEITRSVMDGYNVCVFAYGPTGSGKTFTMHGPSSGSNKELGINFLILNDLFKISSSREDVKYQIQVQMLEVYNEEVHDLLGLEEFTTKLENSRSSGNGGLNLTDVNMLHVRSTSEIINLMKLNDNGICSSAAMNYRSSRSHSILTVHVHGKELSGATINSCLHLVDLAGSEKVDKSEVTEERLKDAQQINKSLSYLEDVITALVQKNSHIPYSNSKLTELLQNSLGGNAKIMMLVHVSPEADSFGETISTLKFAQKTSTLELGSANVNKEGAEIRELKHQIDKLTKALTIKDGKNSAHSHTMKENTPAAERMKPMDHTTPVAERMKPMDHTPPRPGRLNFESGSVLKIPTIAIIDDRKALKSPVSKRLPTKYTTIPNRRLSSEGLIKENKKGIATSTACLLASPRGLEPLEKTIDSHIVLLDSTNAIANLNMEKSFVTETSVQSTRGSNLQTRLPKMDSSSRRIFQKKTSSQSRDVDKATPQKTNSVIRSLLVNSNRKENTRSKIRKSIQSIGRLLEGSDKRSNQCQPQRQSSLFLNNTNADVKSPTESSAKLRSRQSLTPIEILGVKGSRRSSLGGKSVDSYSICNNTARSPPQVRSSINATKR